MPKAEGISPEIIALIITAMTMIGALLATAMHFGRRAGRIEARQDNYEEKQEAQAECIQAIKSALHQLDTTIVGVATDVRWIKDKVANGNRSR